MKYFNNIHNAEELRKAYRQNVINMHPDRGGNEEEFKAMQAEFEALKKQYQNGTAYNYESRQTETAEEKARREAEEQREREEWARWEAEEKAAREQEERERAERIRKAQEVTAAAVRAWAGILERIPATVSGKKRAYDFTDKKACAAYIAATKRNIKAVINHYFPGLDVKVTISGEIWKEKFSIAWEDGPTADELRETCKELEFFIPSYYESDPYADYGDYKTREGSAPWREAYGQALGDVDNFETVRTLSEEGEEQAANIAAGIFADFDPAKLHKTNERFKMTFNEWHKFAELCNIDGVFRHFENLIRDYTGNNEGMAYYSSLRRYLRDHVKVSVTKKEKAPEFKPTYGPTLKAIKKALGGNVFAKMQETKRRENDWTPCDFSVLLGDLQGVKLCKPFSYDMETYYSPVYFTSYKTESTRREKFEAVGITMNGASVKAVREDVAAKIREELDDIEKQRQQWKQEQTAKASQKADNGKKAAKTTNTPNDTQNADSASETAPAEGLTLEDIAEGVAVIGDSRTTYKHRREIKAHGAKWNKEAQRWEATNPDDVAKLRAWFAMREQDEPTADTSDESEAEALRGATLQEIERHSDRTNAPAWLKPGQTFRRTTSDGREVVAICTRILLDGFAYLTANGCGITDHVAAFAAFDFDSVTPCDIDDKATEFAHMLHNFQRIRKDFEKWQTAHPYTEQSDTATASAPADEPTDTTTTAQEAPEIAAMLEAMADMLRTFADIMQQAKQWEGVTIPADTLERWKQETNEGTKTAAARFCEVCACLASLTPDSRRDFDALGVIFWTLSEQIRNGYNPDTLQGATDYTRAQLFDLIERTQTRNQADRLREVLDPDNNPRREAA